jgi:hypothetical protein
MAKARLTNEAREDLENIFLSWQNIRILMQRIGLMIFFIKWSY